MKRMTKDYEKYLDINHYVSFLKKQPAHMQHVYAVLFAGSITLLLAAAILYFDYGFWHERYNRNEVVLEALDTESLVTVQSPGEMMKDFFKEANEKLKNINTNGKDLLEGREMYTKEGLVEGAE